MKPAAKPWATGTQAGAERWMNYLANLHDYAATPVPLAVHGTLVRVAGLVLEAAGIRVPVGSLCEVMMEGQPPVQAEVVGFAGDRAFRPLHLADLRIEVSDSVGNTISVKHALRRNIGRIAAAHVDDPTHRPILDEPRQYA